MDKKGLILYARCIMSNHLHLIAAAKENNLSYILRDFKKFTSKQIIKAIQENEHESRRVWMLSISSRKERRIAVTANINSGDKITNQKNYTVLLLYFRN
jgi:REP element-mobilizing transposase RayT